MEGSDVVPPGGDLAEYRAEILRLHADSQASYDKTVVTLSGGALGLSFAFVRDFVAETGPASEVFLLLAWVTWGASLTAMLFSHLTSTWALRRTLSQIDSDEVYDGPIGGRMAQFTQFLNVFGGVAFLAGVAFLLIFVRANL